MGRTADGWWCDMRVGPGRSTIGGGSLPGETLPTWVVSVAPDAGESTPEQAAGELAARLRHADTPVIARVEHGRLLLDPRTVLEGEEEALCAAVIRASVQ